MKLRPSFMTPTKFQQVITIKSIRFQSYILVFTLEIGSWSRETNELGRPNLGGSEETLAYILSIFLDKCKSFDSDQS